MTARSSNGTDAPRRRWARTGGSTRTRPSSLGRRRGGGRAAQEAPSQTRSAPGVDMCSHLGITVPRPDGQHLRTEPLGSLQGLKGVASRALSTNNPPYEGPKTRNYAEGHAVQTRDDQERFAGRARVCSSWLSIPERPRLPGSGVAKEDNSRSSYYSVWKTDIK